MIIDVGDKMLQNTIEIGRNKKIVLVAHDNKKEELVEWAKCNCKLSISHNEIIHWMGRSRRSIWGRAF
jgi:hypothetical protein